MLHFVCDRCERKQVLDVLEWPEGHTLEGALDILEDDWQIIFDRLLCGECVQATLEFIDAVPTKAAE